MNTDWENAVICPYCGRDDSDDRYDGEGCFVYTCQSCGKEYDCSVAVMIRYTTTKKEGQL